MSTSDEWQLTDQPCERCGAPLAKQTTGDGERTRCTNDACPQSRR